LLQSTKADALFRKHQNEIRIHAAICGGDHRTQLSFGFRQWAYAPQYRECKRLADRLRSATLLYPCHAAAALDAAEVEIYSDVDGVALCDPRRIPEAPFLTEIGANQLLAMAEEGSVILHPRAVRAAQEKKMSIRIRNTFTQMPGSVIHHRPTTTNPNPISLAHQGKQILVHTLNSAKELPELLDAGNGRFLLLDDVYADMRLEQLGEKYGDISEERGWGTVSVIFAGKSEENAPELPDAEKVRSPSDRWRYLLREEQITPTLNTLFKLFFT